MAITARIPRRTFLQSSTAVALTPYFHSVATAQRESDPIRVAAIGVGGRGRVIGMQAARQQRVVACADVYRRHAEQFAGAVGTGCEVYEDYRRVLDRDDVDAITCGTPDHWHARIAIDAMEAGKDVYCEKPLSLTIDESRLLCEVAARTKRIFQVGTQQRSECGGVFLEAVAIARSGLLGERLRATCSVGKATTGGPFAPAQAPGDLNFDFWLGQAPAVEFCPNRVGWNFRWWLEYSGGQVTDWGVHHADIALWALGGEATGVVEVAGQGKFPGVPRGASLVEFLNGRNRLPQSYNVAQEFDCTCKLPSGNEMQLTSGPNELIIQGERGKIRVNRGGLTGKVVQQIRQDQSAKARLAEDVIALYRGMPMGSHMGNFFHCIRQQALPISDIWSHAHAVNACHMANIAMFVNRPLQFDPEAYRFVGDDEANAFLRRQQRSPWQLQA